LRKRTKKRKERKKKEKRTKKEERKKKKEEERRNEKETRTVISEEALVASPSAAASAAAAVGPPATKANLFLSFQVTLCLCPEPVLVKMMALFKYKMALQKVCVSRTRVLTAATTQRGR
jgi:outer membrane biosynthesis protein TonB